MDFHFIIGFFVKSYNPDDQYSPRRILVLGGVSRSLVNFRGSFIKALMNSGAEVHAAAPGLSANLKALEELQSWGVICHDVPLRRTGINPIQDFLGFLSLYFLIRKISPDVFFGYTIKPVIYGIISAWLAGVPSRYALITGLGYAFTGEAVGKRKIVQVVAKKLYALSLSKSDLVFFQNPDDRQVFVSTGLLDRNTPSRVVNGSGVDLEHFSRTPFIGQSVVFLFIGRLIGDKGVREYYSAAKKVKSRHGSVRFLLVGDIDENPDSIQRDELRSWQESGVVEYLGRLEDVRPAIAECSVYVLPSYREGTPRTVLEAMAMGRPVITTDAPGCRETVVHGSSGFLVPVKNVDALVEAMERFILDPDLTFSMGENSYQVALEKYDVHKVNNEMLSGMSFR